MPDWTEQQPILEYVRSIGKPEHLVLMETEYKPRLSPEEIEYLDLIARLKAYQEQEAERIRMEAEVCSSQNGE